MDVAEHRDCESCNGDGDSGSAKTAKTAATSVRPFRVVVAGLVADQLRDALGLLAANRLGAVVADYSAASLDELFAQLVPVEHERRTVAIWLGRLTTDVDSDPHQTIPWFTGPGRAFVQFLVDRHWPDDRVMRRPCGPDIDYRRESSTPPPPPPIAIYRREDLQTPNVAVLQAALWHGFVQVAAVDWQFLTRYPRGFGISEPCDALNSQGALTRYICCVNLPHLPDHACGEPLRWDVASHEVSNFWAAARQAYCDFVCDNPLRWWWIDG